jgi:hypothetical protein
VSSKAGNISAIETLLNNNPAETFALHVKQIVGICGAGKISDGSACSAQFRTFIQKAPTDALQKYANDCLDSVFEGGGFVLQDIVNEFGRRLNFSVTNGLYKGIIGQIGFDGLWSAAGHSLIVEVKTTLEAFIVDIDTLADYRSKLIANGSVSDNSSVLIVVGRGDTAAAEAQIRGSRQAWTTRVISVGSLAQLVALKESTGADTAEKIHSLLTPFESTKLDAIVDLAFTAVSSSADPELQPDAGVREELEAKPSSYKQIHTPKELIESLRTAAITALSAREHVPLTKQRGALYSSPDGNLKVVCTFSKKHPGGEYWYAYHKRWDQYLETAKVGYFVLGCVDRDEAFVIPRGWMVPRLNALYTTGDGDKIYWHIHLEEYGPKLEFRLFKESKLLSLAEFRMQIKK